MNEISFLENVIRKLNENGFIGSYYTSNYELIYPTVEPEKYYLDSTGKDRRLELFWENNIDGCRWVENPKFTIFKNIVHECEIKFGYSFGCCGSPALTWGFYSPKRVAEVVSGSSF